MRFSFPGRRARLALCGALLIAPVLGGAAPAVPEDPSRPRAELKELRTRIESLRKGIADSETSHSEVADALKDTEQGISETSRRLRDLADQKEAALAELNTLGLQAQALGTRINEQQRQLEHLLHNQYVHRGQEGALRHLFSGSNPNQSARNLHYLSLIARSKLALVGSLREALAEKQRLAEAAETRNDELARIEAGQKKEQASLLKQQTDRRTMLANLSDKIETQRGEIATLQRDENRLTRLIDDIERMLRERREAARRAAEAARKAEEARRAEEARKAEAARREREARKSAKEGGKAVPEASETAKADDDGGRANAVAKNEREPESFAFEGSLARHRGQLHLPVRGELSNRFGTPRAEGRSSWKGVFIRAGEGAAVKAIAPGRVVFADWLRGFGNLLIVDHGDSYLTIYGYNEALLKKVGDTVKGGDTVASVGSSGGSRDSGLYFELRYQGRAVDPLQWVSLR